MLSKQKWGSEVPSDPQAQSSLEWGSISFPISRSPEWGHGPHCEHWEMLAYFVSESLYLIVYSASRVSLKWSHMCLFPLVRELFTITDDLQITSQLLLWHSQSSPHQIPPFLSGLSWEGSLFAPSRRWGMWGLRSKVTSPRGHTQQQSWGSALCPWTRTLPITMCSLHT